MVGIDDMVTELELDVLDLACDDEILCDGLFFDCLLRNDVLLRCGRLGRPCSSL